MGCIPICFSRRSLHHVDSDVLEVIQRLPFDYMLVMGIFLGCSSCASITEGFERGICSFISHYTGPHKEMKSLVGRPIHWTFEMTTAFARHLSSFSHLVTYVATKLPMSPVFPPKYKVGGVVLVGSKFIASGKTTFLGLLTGDHPQSYPNSFGSSFSCRFSISVSLVATYST